MENYEKEGFDVLNRIVKIQEQIRKLQTKAKMFDEPFLSEGSRMAGMCNNDVLTPLIHAATHITAAQCALEGMRRGSSGGGQCTKFGCERVTLVWLKRQQGLQTGNGFLIPKLDGWYCPVCSGSYGDYKGLKRGNRVARRLTDSDL